MGDMRRLRGDRQLLCLRRRRQMATRADAGQAPSRAGETGGNVKPTIEEVRAEIEDVREGERPLSESAYAAIIAALDVAEGAAEYDCCDDVDCVINIFRATLAP